MKIRYMSDLHLIEVCYVLDHEYLADGFDSRKLIEI